MDYALVAEENSKQDLDIILQCHVFLARHVTFSNKITVSVSEL